MQVRWNLKKCANSVKTDVIIAAKCQSQRKIYWQEHIKISMHTLSCQSCANVAPILRGGQHNITLIRWKNIYKYTMKRCVESKGQGQQQREGTPRSSWTCQGGRRAVNETMLDPFSSTTSQKYLILRAQTTLFIHCHRKGPRHPPTARDQEFQWGGR